MILPNVRATAILHADKIEARNQWERDPCAADTVDDRERGTLDYYRALRRHRYHVYAPWFDEAIRFSDWREKDILEIGVGMGSDHYRFSELRNRMTALDLSREHLRHTRNHLHLENLITKPVHGDAERLMFADETFDLVYAFGVLHHTPDASAAIAEIRRVLRPGGTAIFAVYHRYSLFILNFVIRHGIVRGRLWRDNWRTLISRVEGRVDQNSAAPLVKLYSRRQVRQLVATFSRVDVVTRHPGLIPFQALSPRWRSVTERVLTSFGWYLIVRAVK